MWVTIIGVIVLLTIESRAHREELLVSSVVVSIDSPNRDEHLITEEMVWKMLSTAKVKIEADKSKVSTLPMSYIEEVIGKNGFVERVDVYADYRGVVSIDVVERSALIRFMVDGYNCYITREGFVFSAPSTTALDTQIVTGSYQPIFPAKYTGDIRAYTAEKIAQIDLEIERVEQEKNPIYLREMENDEDKSAVRKRYINRSIWESRDDFDKRVVALREENRKLRELYAYRQRVVESDLKVLERKQEAYREEQKKLQKKCDDIYNLIIFVEMVEEDSFWRSELSQLDLSGDKKLGNMRLRFAVRSGKFVVTFGEITGRKSALEGKMTRLQNFYEEALPRVGWDRYRDINIEFENQVVCKR